MNGTILPNILAFDISAFKCLDTLVSSFMVNVELMEFHFETFKFEVFDSLESSFFVSSCEDKVTLKGFG